VTTRSQGAEDVLHTVLGVAEQHGRVISVEEWVLDAGVAGGQRTLEDDDVVGIPHREHGIPAIGLDGSSGVIESSCSRVGALTASTT
jgi:hypothetical protein